MVSKTFQTCTGVPHSLPINDYRDTFPGIKRPERRVDHSPPPRGEVKNWWSFTSIPPMRSWHGQGRDGFVEKICYSSGDSGAWDGVVVKALRY